MTLFLCTIDGIGDIITKSEKRYKRTSVRAVGDLCVQVVQLAGEFVASNGCATMMALLALCVTRAYAPPFVPCASTRLGWV
ncbi:MAG: hypothetical protein LBL45_10120 [Treponema sp.]|nr:hypothetical protein [Treponema sp.]